MNALRPVLQCRDPLSIRPDETLGASRILYVAKRELLPGGWLEDSAGGTRSLLSQTALGAELLTFQSAASEFGLGRYRITGQGRYVVFSGHPGLRHEFVGTRYLRSNPKLITVGVASWANSLRNSIKVGGLTVILIGALDTLEWALDDTGAVTLLPELLVDLGIVAGETLLAYGVSTALVAGLSALLGAAGVASLPVVVPSAIGVAVLAALPLVLPSEALRQHSVEVVRRAAEELSKESLSTRADKAVDQAGKWWSFLNSPNGVRFLQRVLSQ